MEGPGLEFSEAIIDNGAFGKHVVRFEAGLLAQQADGSAAVYLDGDTMLLSTTTAAKTPRDSIDFFPLTVDVEERMYAAGRIPGSFFRREGRPSENAILACRLIDRPIRPSFVKGLRNEVQVVVTVLALNPEVYYDVVAINAASMSTQIAGLPFSGPIGGVRMALIGDQWVCFPTVEQRKESTFDMVVAGRVLADGDVAIMMVEAESTPATWDLVRGGRTAPTEEVVATGLEAAKPFIKVLCDAQLALAAKLPKETYDFPIFKDYEDDVYAAVEELGSDELARIEQIAAKLERQDAESALKARIKAELAEKFPERENEISGAFKALMKKIVRKRVLDEGVRIDGRGPRDIRTLSADAGIIPRVHGSALFQRGETQILGVSTLNMLDMEQKLDTLSPQTTRRYMHNYNMPPYSTGETGRVGSPKRREVGHGNLAERALIPVLPTREEFPYAIRQVSEAIGSNGSTSMGSVCASTLALLNAGVPLRASVAGIAMGLMSETDENGETKYLALTDILGAEDALGDMDFKVAGTSEFVTALQLDTKLDGIPSSVLADALNQAHDAREAILDTMAEVIQGPDEMSPIAPKITTVKVPVSKIGEVIGPKGKTINQITEDTGAEVSIEDDGTVFVSAASGEAADAAIEKINSIANPQQPKVGERYLGTVVKTVAFGAFVSITPGTDGLIHISNLGGNTRVENVEDVINVGDKVEVEIRDIDNRGKISLVPVEDGE